MKMKKSKNSPKPGGKRRKPGGCRKSDGEAPRYEMIRAAEREEIGVGQVAQKKILGCTKSYFPNK